MELKTIAEFVETDEIARRLADMGLDYLQGYSIAEPEPIEEYTGFLAKARCVGVG
jgi:EAL domain-containing protein (putative c-di-GMP-specific phosphodiesterase class I)